MVFFCQIFSSKRDYFKDPFAAFGNTNTASTQQSNFGNFADFGFGNFQQPKPQVQNAAEFGNFGNEIS